MVEMMREGSYTYDHDDSSWDIVEFMGHTNASDQKIRAILNSYRERNPNYTYLTENCQFFARHMIQKLTGQTIRIETDILRDSFQGRQDNARPLPPLLNIARSFQGRQDNARDNVPRVIQFISPIPFWF